MTKPKKEDDHGKRQAAAQLASIREMVKEMEEAADLDQDSRYEEARDRIQEDALSVEVRTAWHSPTSERVKPEEYRILLCTGGPAVQIVGDLHEYGHPETAKLQYQDWFTPWTDYNTTDEEDEDLLTYAQQFYYGEG